MFKRQCKSRNDENLCMSKLVLCMIHVDRPQELLCCFLVVNELSFRDHTGIQHFVPARTKKDLRSFVVSRGALRFSPLLEISIQDPTGESLPADADSFQHTVTSQLMYD